MQPGAAAPAENGRQQVERHGVGGVLAPRERTGNQVGLLHQGAESVETVGPRRGERIGRMDAAACGERADRLEGMRSGHLWIHVPHDDSEHVGRGIEAAIVVAEILAPDPVERPAEADDGLPDRIVREKPPEDRIGHDRQRIGLAHGDLLEHDPPLALDILLVEGRAGDERHERVPRLGETVRRHICVVLRQLEIRGSVDDAADRPEGRESGIALSRRGVSFLEEQVLEEVRHPGKPPRFVARAHSRGDLDEDGAAPRTAVHHHRHSVLAHEREDKRRSRLGYSDHSFGRFRILRDGRARLRHVRHSPMTGRKPHAGERNISQRPRRRVF